MPTRPGTKGYTWEAEYVRCGRTGCTRCPHGPYWYGYARVGKRVRKVYGGRVRLDGPASGGAMDACVDRLDAIFDRRTATFDLACEILGVGGLESLAFVKRRFNALALANHPDRGGSERSMARVSAAWSLFRTVYDYRRK